MINFLIKLNCLLLLCLFASLNSAAQKTDGFFRVEKQNGVWWFITPEGKPFFSNGVNVVDKGIEGENYSSKNPGWAMFRFYKSEKDWQDDTLKRLRSWNFNTIGGWSDKDLEKRGEMPYTKAFWWGEKLIPWGDVFSEETERIISEKAAKDIPSLKDDKNLIGYFTDNELKWWDDAVFYHHLEQPRESKTRQRLMLLFQEHYKNDFAAVKRDFETGKATNFKELEFETKLKLKPNGNGIKIIDEFLFLLASHYYKMVHDAIRLHDKNHLILGDRYPSWYSQAVVRASIPYVDVVSTNYMADWNDGNISHFYLDSLYRMTKKPIIVTEYYMAAMENRSGNKNSSAVFPTVKTQKERAESFKTNLTAYAKLPYVIGAHWFQFYDEPTHGRELDGEDFNMGLVDIHNKPYEELVNAATSIKPEFIHAKSLFNKKQPLKLVPKTTEKVEEGLLWWNKEKSLILPIENVGEEFPFADLYAAWDRDFLYLAVYAVDYFDPRNYQNSLIPDSERKLWTLNFGNNIKPLQIIFSEEKEVRVGNSKIESHFWTTPTRDTMLIKLPASLFGKKQFRAGNSINLRSELKSHSRAETMRWNQNLVLEKLK